MAAEQDVQAADVTRYVSSGVVGFVTLASLVLNMSLVYCITAARRLQLLGYYYVASRCTAQVIASLLTFPPSLLSYFLSMSPTMLKVYNTSLSHIASMLYD